MSRPSRFRHSSAASRPMPLRAAGRGLIISLLVATAFMRAACQQLLEEETDVRVSKQVPDAGNCGTLPDTFTIEFSTEMEASSVSAVNAGGACTATV